MTSSAMVRERESPMLDMMDYEELEAEISRIYGDIETELIVYLVRKMRSGADLSPDDWRIRKLRGLGTMEKDIAALLQRLTSDHADELEDAIGKAVTVSCTEDNSFLEDVKRFARSEVAERITVTASEAIRARVRSVIRNARSGINLTNSAAVEASLRSYRDAINRAYLSVFEGADTIEGAVRKASRALGGSGLILSYRDASGTYSTISLDAGIRRNIRTSVAQATAEYTMEDCERNGLDLVQVSAHAGARPSHRVWQGGVYSLKGKTKGYRTLEEACGYGSVDGLCGVNCRHHFFPYYPGMAKADWHIDIDARQSDELYELTQRQRAGERRIRRWKRMQAVAKETGDEEGYRRASSFLRKAQADMRSFISETGLARRYGREQI